MEFKYKSNKLKEYRKNGIILTFPLFVIIPLMSIYMYSEIKYLENSWLIILLTILLSYVAGGIGILIGIKRAKKEFESYKIECDNEIIFIKSKMQHKKINVKDIIKIQKDKKYYYIILNKMNKIKILNYIDNNDEFEKYFNSIFIIENFNNKYNIFEYIPVILYFGLLFITRYGNIKLYFIFATLLILSLIYSIIKCIFNQFNIKWKILHFIIYGYILLMIIIGLYNTINYIFQ